MRRGGVDPAASAFLILPVDNRVCVTYTKSMNTGATHMIDFSHLNALETGLSHERVRLANARTENERKLRAVWVAQYERQIANERKFLGLPAADAAIDTMTDEDLLAELGV